MRSLKRKGAVEERRAKGREDRRRWRGGFRSVRTELTGRSENGRVKEGREENERETSSARRNGTSIIPVLR